MDYDVFLSYRRDGGAPLAQLLYTKLTDAGYNVFIDLEEMQQGDFNEQLLTVIEHAKDIILILSKGALDRCVNEGDWVRRELCHALQHKKNIVPYMVPEYKWPTVLPHDLEKLPKLQSVEYHPIYYSASLERLESYLLSQKHRSEEKPKEKPNKKTEELITAQEEPIEDDDSLEPEIEIHIEEPIKKGFLGAKYSSEQIRSIRDDNRAQIIASLEEIKNLLSLSSIPSRRAYKNAASALILVRDQLGHYTFWGMDIDQAIVSFEKNYTDNVEKIRICARKGNVYLTEACRKELQQMAVGLETIIRILG